MPFLVPLLAPAASVTAGKIALPLVGTLLLPLALGLVVAERAPRWAAFVQPIVRVVSTIALAALLALTTVVNLRHTIDIVSSRALIALLLLFAGSFAIGFAVASPRPERRVVLGLGTAQRNVAAATIVAVEDIKDNDTLVLVVVASVIDLIILIPLARWLRAKRVLPGPNMEARDDTCKERSEIARNNPAET